MFFTRELRGQSLLLISFPRVAHSRCICTTEKALCGLSAGNVWVECAGSERGCRGQFLEKVQGGVTTCEKS